MVAGNKLGKNQTLTSLVKLKIRLGRSKNNPVKTFGEWGGNKKGNLKPSARNDLGSFLENSWEEGQKLTQKRGGEHVKTKKTEGERGYTNSFSFKGVTFKWGDAKEIQGTKPQRKIKKAGKGNRRTCKRVHSPPGEKEDHNQRRFQHFTSGCDPPADNSVKKNLN